MSKWKLGCFGVRQSLGFKEVVDLLNLKKNKKWNFSFKLNGFPSILSTTQMNVNWAKLDDVPNGKVKAYETINPF